MTKKNGSDEIVIDYFNSHIYTELEMISYLQNGMRIFLTPLMWIIKIEYSVSGKCNGRYRTLVGNGNLWYFSTKTNFFFVVNHPLVVFVVYRLYKDDVFGIPCPAICQKFSIAAILHSYNLGNVFFFWRSLLGYLSEYRYLASQNYITQGQIKFISLIYRFENSRNVNTYF